MKRIGVLAVQGAVSEHLAMLGRAHLPGMPVRTARDLSAVRGLIIPGGESTVISRLIGENGLFDAIRDFAAEGYVMGTCAGLILCASEVRGSGGAIPGGKDDGAEGRVTPLGLMDMSVSRNGFGRQVDSFETELAARGIDGKVPAVFIRAPYIERVGGNVSVRAEVEGKIVMAENERVLVTSFHPELTPDTRVVRYFYEKIS